MSAAACSARGLANDPAVVLRPGERNATRLLALPFAGGGPLAFKPLAACMTAPWRVETIDMPGHVRTPGEPLGSVEAMRDYVLAHAGAYDWRKTILLGHSLGGYVAYAVALALEARATPCLGVVVSATQPPHCRDPHKPLQRMTDAELFRWVQDLGGLPRQGGEARVLFELFAPALRADVTAFENYEAPREVVLWGTPLLAVGGMQDPICPAAWMPEWSRYARRCQWTQVPGTHLFVASQPDALAGALQSFTRL